MIISFGRYLNIKTFFHKLDPRVKIVLNIVVVLLFFFAENFFLIAIFLMLTSFFFLITTKSWRFMLKMIKIPFVVSVFLLFFNFFTVRDIWSFAESYALQKKLPIPNSKDDLLNLIKTNPKIFDYYDSKIFYYNFTTGNVQQITKIFYDPKIKEYVSWNVSWFKFLKFSVTPFSVFRSFFAGFRIYGIILITTILTYSTKPILLTKAIEDLLFPLRILKIPVSIFAMIISITFRFIPTLLDEAERIMKAQSSRGVDFKNGRFSEKIKSLISLVIPLFVVAISKAWELSESMETRSYDPYGRRTRYRKLKLRLTDIIFLFGTILILILVVLISKQIIPLPYWIAISYIKY